MQVEFPDYPLFDETVIAEDRQLIDELAAAYLADAEGTEPEMERFLLGTLLVHSFEEIFAGNPRDNMPSLLWLVHLSGYFGGRWLRGEIQAAQLEAPVLGFSQAPTPESFAGTMANAQVALDAAYGSDEQALAYAAYALGNHPPPEEGEAEIQGLTDLFGYNQGYSLEILESPPDGVEANPNYQIDCTPGLYDCQYATPRLPALASMAALQSTIAAAEEPYTNLVAARLPEQEAAVPRGRDVWSGGLSVQGFSQKAYDQLLDISSSFLETVQATALTMSQATVESDAASARIGALANAAMIVMLEAYMAGLIDGEGEIALPEFT